MQNEERESEREKKHCVLSKNRATYRYQKPSHASKQIRFEIAFATKDDVNEECERREKHKSEM